MSNCTRCFLDYRDDQLSRVHPDAPSAVVCRACSRAIRQTIGWFEIFGLELRSAAIPPPPPQADNHEKTIEIRSISKTPGEPAQVRVERLKQPLNGHGTTPDSSQALKAPQMTR